MAGCIDTAIYQTIIATPGHPRRSRGWIGKLFEYLEWRCIQAELGSSSFLCRYLWFVIWWLLLLSPPVPRVVLASPPARPCHVVTHHHQVSLVTWHGTDPSSSSPALTRIRHRPHFGRDCAEGSNFAEMTKKVSYERDDRAWDLQTIRTISHHLSWRPPPTLTLTHLILDHSQRSAQFIFYSSSKQAASVRIMLSASA